MSCVGLGARLVGFLWGAGLPRFSSWEFCCSHYMCQSLRVRHLPVVAFYLLIITLFPATMATAADDELAPLIPIPGKGADDDLAPLVPPPGTSDPSTLSGPQIRPLSGSVMVSHQRNLEIKNCFSYTPEGGSEYFECNDSVVPEGYETAPLTQTFKVLNWRVNGIEGGNGVVGRIKGTGKSATYIAPDKAPNPSTVAVSAEIDVTGQGKYLVNAELTIVESVVYVDVYFSGRREEHGEVIDYAGLAEIDYVRVATFNGGVQYNLDPHSSDTRLRIDKWDIHSDSVTCTLKKATLRPNVDAPFNGTFFIYSSLNSYVFGALMEVVGIVRCKDGDSVYDEEVTPRVLFTTSKGPPDPGMQPIAKDGSFSGKSSLMLPLDEDEEGKVTQSMEWHAKKQ